MRGLREDEEWARLLIEAAVGCRVEQNDDGSANGMHDLWILLGTERQAVEIVAAADADSIPLWKLLNGSNDRWIDSQLAGGWRVEFAPTARAKAIRTELPGFLGDLERVGINDFHTTDLPLMLRDTATALGIVRATQGPTDFPGSIYPNIDQDGINGLTATESSLVPLSTWVADFLRAADQSDVLAKLARSGVDRRHVFILIPGFTTAPISVVAMLLHRDDLHGIVDPDLPPEVTDVWLASTWSVGSGVRWSPDAGWHRFRTDPADQSGKVT